MVDVLRYFSFQPVIHDWCNKDRRMCSHVCVMVFIKEPLLLIVVAAEDFLSDYLSGPLLHVRCHNTVNNVLTASLTKHFLPFIFTFIVSHKVGLE